MLRVPCQQTPHHGHGRSSSSASATPLTAGGRPLSDLIILVVRGQRTRLFGSEQGAQFRRLEPFTATAACRYSVQLHRPGREQAQAWRPLHGYAHAPSTLQQKLHAQTTHLTSPHHTIHQQRTDGSSTYPFQFLVHVTWRPHDQPSNGTGQQSAVNRPKDCHRHTHTHSYLRFAFFAGYIPGPIPY